MNIRQIRPVADATFEAWGRWVARHAIHVLVAVVLLSAALISQAPRIRIDTSIEGFLLEDDPILILYNDFRDRFDRDDTVMLAIRTPEIFSFSFLEKLRELHENLEDELIYLDEVQSLINARSTRGVEGELIVEDLFEDWPQDESELAVIRDRALANPIYENLLISKNRKYTVMLVKFSTFSESSDELDLSGFEEDDLGAGAPDGEEEKPFLSGGETIEAVQKLREIVTPFEAADFEISLAGAPVMTERLTTDMSRDMRKFLGLSILASGVLLFMVFRRISGTWIPLFVVLLSLGSTIGIASLIGIPLQVPTQILPAFLLAVGVGDSVHILAIFYQHLRRGDSREDAIAGALAHSGFPVLMTSLTTAGALGSFTSATLAPIHNLGIIAPIGVMLALLYTVTLLPALLALIRVGAEPRGGARLGFIDAFLHRCTLLSTRKPWTVVAVSALLIAVGLMGAVQLRFSHNPVHWFPVGDPLRDAMDMVSVELEGVVTMEVLFESGRENALQDPKLLSTMRELQIETEALRHGEIFVGKTLSLTDILVEIHQALNGGRSEFRVIPQDRQLVAQELLLFENSGSDDLEDVTDSLFQTGRMTLRLPWVDAYAYAPVIRKIEADYRAAVGEDIRITVTGLMPLLSRTFEAVIHSMARSYVIAILVITPLMMLLLASVRLGLLSMLPNLMPIILTLGIMGTFDFPLDGFTLLIGSIALGLAVDDTIHFMNSFRRCYEETGDAADAVERTLKTAGQAMLVTTLVLCAGFFTFTLAYMESIFNFGFLTGTALALAFLGDVTLAPALMVLVTRRRARQADAAA